MASSLSTKYGARDLERRHRMRLESFRSPDAQHAGVVDAGPRDQRRCTLMCLGLWRHLRGQAHGGGRLNARLAVAAGKIGFDDKMTAKSAGSDRRLRTLCTSTLVRAWLDRLIRCVMHFNATSASRRT